MEESITFVSDECPPSANTYYRNWRGRMVLSKRGREFKKNMASKCAVGTKNKILGPIKVRIDIRFGDRRKRDLDNHLKSVFDAFKDILFEDDVMIQEIVATKETGCAPENAGFTLKISPVC